MAQIMTLGEVLIDLTQTGTDEKGNYYMDSRNYPGYPVGILCDFLWVGKDNCGWKFHGTDIGEWR